MLSNIEENAEIVSEKAIEYSLLEQKFVEPDESEIKGSSESDGVLELPEDDKIVSLMFEFDLPEQRRNNTVVKK